MITEDWKTRLVAEKYELDQKIGKLFAFMQTSQFESLAYTPRSLLSNQYTAMCTYSDILGLRIQLK
jgi:hypothetical protein